VGVEDGGQLRRGGEEVPRPCLDAAAPLRATTLPDMGELSGEKAIFYFFRY
jgi:hypothetical protein